MLKAIIFDFDGTIIDTETAWYTVFKEAYAHYGVALSLEMYAKCLGTNLQAFNPYTYLVTSHAQLMEKETLRPGILTLLQQAKEAGLQIGLASSSSRQWIDQYVDKLGIRDFFDCYCTADTVTNVKPDPELYLQALKQLGVKGKEAIAIEDSPNGAQAAVAAGLYTVVIPNAITKQLPFGTGHHTMDTLEPNNVQELLTCFSQ
ncbi:HAD family phosphatase [Lysinibacillus sp. F5]|uniref:HAD family hydrolase n=1 Tax=Lysinibacillus sp. F5 TaxID=1700846 RepID=UPI0007388932|nr:HAD family hydrolase [Lysinibacillus sp. F5]KUF29781.1 phosphoglycolate phosphatase [Lysinibacillus sp. F5]